MEDASSQVTLILAGGLILADPTDPAVEAHGRTLIAGDRLLAVNTSEARDLETDAPVLDCSGCLVIPGLVNAHIHGAMSLLRGLADDLPLDRWLNEYIFPAEARHADPEFVYTGTLLSAAESVLAGVTTIADGYFHMESAAQAAIDVGVRAVIAQGILDVPAPDAPTGGSWRNRTDEFLAGFPSDPLVTPALFCHSPYLCGPSTLQEAHEICSTGGLPLFIHVSETVSEVEEILRRHGARPVEHLDRLGLLGPRLIAVHVAHVDDRERELLAQSHTRAVHCPESNMKLASGAADASALRAAGVRVGLGTDGAASNNNLDLFEEMRTASLLAKLVTGDPEALDARAALRCATIDGAIALGMDDRIGSLVEGKAADIAVVDLDRPHLRPLFDPVSHLVYSAKGSDVKHVVVNGFAIVRDGRLLTVDEARLRERVRSKALDIARDLGVDDRFEESAV